MPGSEKEPSFNIHTELRKISEVLNGLEIDPVVDVCCGENHIHLHFPMGDNTVDVGYIPNLRPARYQDSKIEIVSCVPNFSQILEYKQCTGGFKKLIDIFRENHTNFQKEIYN